MTTGLTADSAPSRNGSDDHSQIRAMIADFARATAAKDIERIMSHQAADVVTFDCHSNLYLAGAAALRAHLQACFACMSGPMLFEIHDLKIEAGDDLAFAHYLVRCGATGMDGQEHRTWLRATTCLRRIDGDWKVVHGHCSAPFDPQSGQVMLNLQPEPPRS